MGAVKRHLEGLTEELLESVRSTESALLVARRPITEPGAHSATLRAVLDLGAVWLCVPDTTELDRLDAELARWNTAPPPDLALDWLDAGLCAVPLDPEWAVAHSEGVWANYGGGEQ